MDTHVPSIEHGHGDGNGHGHGLPGWTIEEEDEAMAGVFDSESVEGDTREGSGGTTEFVPCTVLLDTPVPPVMPPWESESESIMCGRLLCLDR